MVLTLDDALAALRRDPTRPVEAELQGMHVELRVAPPSAANVFRAIGPWEGETTEELLRRLDEARRAGGSADAPEL
jgi:hypothetical protein